MAQMKDDALVIGVNAFFGRRSSSSRRRDASSAERAVLRLGSDTFKAPHW
jgi:hypothetical protein